MPGSERLQVNPVKDGPLPKSRVASATPATLEMAPLQISQMESLKNFWSTGKLHTLKFPVENMATLTWKYKLFIPNRIDAWPRPFHSVLTC